MLFNNDNYCFCGRPTSRSYGDGVRLIGLDSRQLLFFKCLGFYVVLTHLIGEKRRVCVRVGCGGLL